MKNRIVRLNEVKSMTGLSRSTIYAQIAKGNFPKQVQLTEARSVGWYESAIVQWVESRKVVSQREG
jgi:prophage regulatory protein